MKKIMAFRLDISKSMELQTKVRNARIAVEMGALTIGEALNYLEGMPPVKTQVCTIS